MSPQVDIQNASAMPVPTDSELTRWICAAVSLADGPTDAEISVRLVDESEMATLNRNYRNKTGPTNVLSFPSDLPTELNIALLGDIVICAPVVHAEATAQHKPEQAHWAHMAVHGTLHLLGYDHVDAADADVMESLETIVMNSLNYPCPYAGYTAQEH
jgi:probable rRNA maturation factor